jgi:hypothetical protein
MGGAEPRLRSVIAAQNESARPDDRDDQGYCAKRVQENFNGFGHDPPRPMLAPSEGERAH